MKTINLPKRTYDFSYHFSCKISKTLSDFLTHLDRSRFMVANRTVGTGLTASAVISSWLYSTALLGASLLTYKYGLALGVWWGASASTMVCFLSLISIEAKRRAPNAHTLLELIRVRYGTTAHLIWIVFCLLTNILNFSSMLLGASAAVTSLTGMDVIASTYLLPVSGPSQ